MKHTTTRFMGIALMVAACAGFTACAVGGVGQAFTSEQVASIKPGMTLAQVTQLLGSPQHTSMTQYGTMHSWVYVAPVTVTPLPFPTGAGKVTTQQVSINFVDGKVADTAK